MIRRRSEFGLFFLAAAVALGLATATGAFQGSPAHAQEAVPGVMVSETSLEIEEGNSGTYEVELDSVPAGDVTVTIGGITGTDLTLDKSSLTFTDQNWNTRQTVTVSAAADDDATHDRATLTHTASGGGHDSVSTDLPVTVTDTTRMRLVAVVERVPEGESRPIRAMLPMPLDEDVTITVAVVPRRGRADEYVLSANTRLTIAAGATESTGEVIFTSLDDFENEGTRSFDATLTPDHPRVDEDTESFSVVEDDHTIVDLEVAPSTIFENGGEATLRAIKYRLHEGVVKMAVSLEPSDRATLSSTTLTFEPGSIYSTETLTITAVDNAADEPDQTITISATVTEGRGVWTPLPLELTIVDDDNMSPEVALVLMPQLVREGLVSAVTAVASGPLDDEATITVSASPGHADTRPDDYVLSANTVLTIPAGGTRSTGTVTIATVDDMLGGGLDNPFSGRGRSREVTVSGTVTGGGGVADPADQTLTILDDDLPVLAALVATPATISEGEVSTITLRAFQPVPADMIVTVQQRGERDAAELSADRVLMIAAGETESTGVVTLTALQDDDRTHEVVGAGARTSGDNQFVVVQYYANVFIIDDDIENAWVTVSPVPARMYEGETSTVIAKLSQPLPDDVTITIGFDESHRDHTATEDDFTLSANRTLTIPAGSMSSTGLVTLTASDDEYYGPGQSRKVIIDVSATGIDQSKVGIHSDWTIHDDERSPRVTLAVAPASIAESDGQSTVTASLNTIVEGDVVVTVATAPAVAANPDDFTQSGTLLTIPAGQKNSTGNVTISAVNDDDDGPDKRLVVTGTAEVVGMEDSGLVSFPYPESLTIKDDDEADLVLSKASLGPSEGGSESYTVALATQPSAEVTVTITGHADTDLTPDPTILIFTTTDWATAKTVTVEAGHDDDTVNDSATLTHTAAGGGYASVAADLPVTVHDDDEADLVLSKASLGPSEGGSESYTVALATRPSAEVTVTITGHADTDLTPDPTILTFTTTDWATAKTVTVEAGHDDDTVNDSATLTHTAAGGGYASVAADLPVTVHDDDEADLVLSKASLGPSEGGSESYTVALATRPSAEVTVTITGHADTDLTPDPTILTFTTTDWATAKTVTVEAGHDDDTVNDSATLTHTAAGGGYASVAADLPVTVHDDDADTDPLMETDPDPLVPCIDNNRANIVTVLSERGVISSPGEVDTWVIPGVDPFRTYFVEILGADSSLDVWGQDVGGSLTLADPHPVSLHHEAGNPGGHGFNSAPGDFGTGRNSRLIFVFSTFGDFVLKVKSGESADDQGIGSYHVLVRYDTYCIENDDGNAVFPFEGGPEGYAFDIRADVSTRFTEYERYSSADQRTHYFAGGHLLGDNWGSEPDEDWYGFELKGSTEYEVYLEGSDRFPVEHRLMRPRITGIYDKDGVLFQEGEAGSGTDPSVTLTFRTAGSGKYYLGVGSNPGGRTGVYNYRVSQTEPDTAGHAASNNSPTGGPGITGLPSIGEKLTATTSGIADADGLENASFSYQWVRHDPMANTDTDILGATGSTYTVTRQDQGAAIKVRVDFTDDGDNDEELTSFALLIPPPVKTTAAGQPTITGTLEVGQILTADTSEISDADRMDKASFGYRWIAGDSDIQNATGMSHTLTEDEEGLAIRVSVTFTDDAENEETLTSDPTGLVQPRSNTPVTRETSSPTDKEDPQNPPPAPKNLTATANSDGSVTLSWEAPDDDSVTGYQVLRRRPREGEKTLLVHVNDTGSTATKYTDRENVTPDVPHAYRVKAINPVGLSGRSNFDNVTPVQPAETVQNSPAKGAPAISGTAQVGETLTVDTSGIADDDGLVNATYRYKWIVSDGGADVDIAGATDSTYTVVADDEGLTIKVRVNFTDDADNDENLTSAATDEVSFAVQQQEASNTPASVQPSITGTARVGETLTADTTGIADEDGLENVSFSYQWLADDADISGATGSTYTLIDSDEGKTVKVEVSFTDNGGNDATLTSAATDVVAAAPTPNSSATGAPAITGTARVGETLTADTSDISDPDGVENAVFAYQWIAGGAEVEGATESNYTLTESEQGMTVQVRVSFTDDARNEEALTSAGTGAVAPVLPPLTVSLTVAAPATHDGSAEFTFEIEFSEEFPLSYKVLKLHAFNVTDGEVLKAQRVDKSSNISWRITVRPDSNADVTVVLPVTTKCGAQGSICTQDGRKLSNSLNFTVSGPNQ